jgi:hypothetical protein
MDLARSPGLASRLNTGLRVRRTLQLARRIIRRIAGSLRGTSCQLDEQVFVLRP